MIHISKIAMSKEDKEWQAECDARTLREYASLKNDKERMQMASARLLKDLADYKEAAKIAK